MERDTRRDGNLREYRGRNRRRKATKGGRERKGKLKDEDNETVFEEL